jgi:hypothetical protein
VSCVCCVLHPPIATVAKKFEKAIITAAILSVIGGMNAPNPKTSVLLLLLGDISGSIYLFLAPKPWEVASKRKEQLRRITNSHREMRSQLKEYSRSGQALLTLAESQKAVEDQLAAIEVLSSQHEQLVLENKQLKKLADDILSECDRVSRVEAQRIKQQAEDEARQIIEATKNSLNNTVYEPQKIAHLQILESIQASKDAALGELERVQALHDKTQAAIEKMKVKAHEEHLQIKKKIRQEAKEQYLRDVERMDSVLLEMENQVKLLTTENQMLRAEIDSLDEPQYPEGWREHEIYARGIIDFYKKLGIKLDYKFSFREGDRIAVRVIPREEKIGEQQLRKYHDRIQRLFDLSQLPNISTTAGTIQFDLRLCELQSPVIDLIPVSSTPYSLSPSTPQLHPELVNVEEMRSHLQRVQQREFVPPEHRFSPFNQTTATEREWVLWLYNHCKIHDQNTIIHTVWQNTRGRGISQGAGGPYIAARSKLHKIFDDAGIPRQRASNAKDD